MTKTTRISIYHGFELRSERWDEEDSPLVECLVFSLADDLDAATDGYRLAYTYETEYEFPFDSLDDIYRRNNAVDGSEENVKAEARSLSVGDVIVITTSFGTYAKRVETYGFGDISFDTLLGKVVK